MPDTNLYCVLRSAFPADLDRSAIEVIDASPPRHCGCCNLERGSARLAVTRA